MTVFVYDGSPGTHTWNDLLPHPVYLDEQGGALVGSVIQRGDIIVCHRVEVAAIAACLRSHSERGVVVVEVGSAGLPEQPADGNYYRRVGPVAENDPAFRACFARFVAALSDGEPIDWRILEDPPPPSALLAYHLLALLPGDAEADRERQALRADAVREAEDIATILRGNANEALSDVEQAEERRAFLRRRC